MKKQRKCYGGLSFRQLKKAMKADDRKVKVVAGLNMSIKFSKEIAYWDDYGYHQNPKFMLWWQKFNSLSFNNHFRYCGIIVSWYTRKQFDKCNDSSTPYSDVFCWLQTGNYGGGTAITISPSMNFWYVTDPDEFRRFPGIVMQGVVNAMEDCAKFCGGSVEIKFTPIQRLPFMVDEWKTYVFGKKTE